MAQAVCTLTLETELYTDVIDSLARVHRALPSRHGAAFRRLDRKLSSIMEGETAIAEPSLQGLGGGRFVLIPPRQLMALVDEAARLGVI